VIGYWVPRTLGVGYYNVRDELSGTMAGKAVLLLCLFKFVSWSVSLGSGTSGGTLAPLFTIGGAMGPALGSALIAFFPEALDVRVAALVGMAAMFAGASRALLASIVFAFETTLQPFALLPLVTGCTGAYLVSALLMKHTIMTEKIARRGVHVPVEYAADSLDQILVSEAASFQPIALRADQPLEEVRDWMADRGAGSEHHGFPVVNGDGEVVGMIRRRDLLTSSEAPQKHVGEIACRPFPVVYRDNTLRQSMDLMARESMGRLPVVDRGDPRRLVGILSGSDIRTALGRRLEETSEAKQTLRPRWFS
jgi:CBS domain-containing protein